MKVRRPAETRWDARTAIRGRIATSSLPKAPKAEMGPRWQLTPSAAKHHCRHVSRTSESERHHQETGSQCKAPVQQSESSHVAVAQTVVRSFAVYPEGHEKLWSPQVTTGMLAVASEKERVR